MNKIESSEYDVVIVGGGPGGTLAAHYGFMRGKGAARWLEGDGNEFQERVTKNYIKEDPVQAFRFITNLENIRDEYDPYPKEVILQIWDKLMVDRK